MDPEIHPARSGHASRARTTTGQRTTGTHPITPTGHGREPGLVQLDRWHPSVGDQADGELANYGGAGRKP